LIDRGQLLGTVLGLVSNHFLLARRKRHFYRRLQKALGDQPTPLTALRADELTAYYRTLEQQLLTRWDAPLVNDFFAMIFYGVLRKLVMQWCGDLAGTLQNDLLTGEGGMISAEPAQRVCALAQLVADDAEFVALLQRGERAAIERALARRSQFAEGYHTYLEKFGDRCADELKLESPTLQDDPLPLLRSIGHLAGQVKPSSAPKMNAGGQTVRLLAEQRVQGALRGKPLQQLIFGWVLKHARRCVRDRENLRFERTHVFGLARQIFVELGRRFYALDLLQEPRDIFYLEVAEILGFVEGTTTCTDLRGLVEVRKSEFARFAQMAPPAARFSTRGIVHQGNFFQPDHLPAADPAELNGRPFARDELHGIGCCPGVVRGRARVVTNPATARLVAGDILVAERTDPSWIMIMPAAAGLLVARGSLLSHAAIVSRELGIPSIVSLTGLTDWLTDGEWVEMDGSTGVVRKVGEGERETGRQGATT
ncbi:MAG: PEP-utilizing enzyme, partial [Chloroflexi bacterium]|nr:PEP-utilizing enzyme [Chloroflexota bacterium]